MTQEAERDVFEGFKVSCAAPPPPYLPAAAPPLALDPQHSSGDEWLGTRSPPSIVADKRENGCVCIFSLSVSAAALCVSFTFRSNISSSSDSGGRSLMITE